MMSHAVGGFVLLLVAALPAGADVSPQPASQPHSGISVAASQPANLAGELRKAGPRWPFKNGDRLYWFGASHTNIGIYCSTVEFYIRTRLPDLKIVSAHTSKPTGLDPSTVARVIDEREPTIVFPEGGFYDTKDPAKFAQAAAAVNKVCADKGARCVFLPTMWLAGATSKLNPAFLAEGADMKAVEARLRKENKLPYGAMLVPATQAEIHGAYFRPAGGLAIDKTMAALKEWGDKNGVLVLETYGDQIAWAKAQWARDPNFVFHEGASPHPIRSGYMCVGIYALERLEAPIVQSRLDIAIAEGTASIKTAVNCDASDVKVEGGGVKFSRLDKVLPVVPPVAVWEIPADPAPMLRQSPYFLAVTGLAAGEYDVVVEGFTLGRASAKELSGGVNLNAVYLRSGQKGQPKVPWRRVWDATRDNTMDKDYVPGPNDEVGKSVWKWEVRAAK